MENKHPCELEDGTFEHDWRYIKDWYGDPSIPNGTCDCSRWECRRCDSSDYDGSLDDSGDYGDYEDWVADDWVKDFADEP